MIMGNSNIHEDLKVFFYLLWKKLETGQTDLVTIF